MQQVGDVSRPAGLAPLPSSPEAAWYEQGEVDGHTIVARALAAGGVNLMFGVVGIPVTPLATAAQRAGIRYIGMRNEQAAGMAAAAAGYLTGRPAALLTVSGPGFVNGLAGLAHASVNCWPMVLLSGACDTADAARGGFQALDQMSSAKPLCKLAARADSPIAAPGVIARAVAEAAAGRPGGTYVDLPSNVLLATTPAAAARAAIAAAFPTPPGGVGSFPVLGPPAAPAPLSRAASLLSTARRPLVIVGKGAAYARAEGAVTSFVESLSIPFVATPMGRGVVSDAHPLCANAARAAALSGADVVVTIGARLNWLLHFGVAPRWSPTVRFVVIDIHPGGAWKDALAAPPPAGSVGLRGHAAVAVSQLTVAVGKLLALGTTTPWSPWVTHLAAIAASSSSSLERRLRAPDAYPLDFHTALRVVRDGTAGVRPAPLIVSEGANTMDMARMVMQHTEPRLKLDAGTWGTMGVGLGYVAAACAADGARLVVALEGDSAVGFSGMELETLVRFRMRAIVIVFNNAGIYGGDRRPGGVANQGRFVGDPPPTELGPVVRHDLMMAALGGVGHRAETATELATALASCIARAYLGPSLIDIVIDPTAGVESGRAHDFNLAKPTAKL